MRVHVIRAAAGCGKTTALTRAYLDLVADGVPVDRIVAITFTRRAAAELTERVGTALRYVLGDREAGERLGAARETYLEALAMEPARAEAALARLGHAPIGTTDHFVRMLLAEFAVDAALELADGRLLYLDVDLTPIPDLGPYLESAARRLLDPPDGELLPGVERLTRYFSLHAIIRKLRTSPELHHLPAISARAVLRDLARELGDALQGCDREVLVTDAPAPVKRWLQQGADPAVAPLDLLVWACRLHGNTRASRLIRERAEGRVVDLGVTRLSLHHVLDQLTPCQLDDASLALADELRQTIADLQARVSSMALEDAAIQGELPHDALTRAATRLVEQHLPDGRYHALLVDEVQDADPAQMELYLALARRPGMKRSVFVGDARQSIYLFRGGEPTGLARLVAEPDVTTGLLSTNHRSSPPLVEAHRLLFDGLTHPCGHGEPPLEPLHMLEASPSRTDQVLERGHPGSPAPVHIVHHDYWRDEQVNEATLDHFWTRVQAAREEPNHTHDSAAVLCATWRQARWAAHFLRRRANDDRAAWVGGGEIPTSRGVGRDLALWLRALRDPADDIAWLAVYKHPSIGLSDAALARIRAGVGIRGREGPVPLGWLHHTEGLEAPHDEADVAALDRALPPLREAADRIGRDDTAEVLDTLLHALHWRLLLRSCPDGEDELARLEALLDWIGERDAEGYGVEALIQLLHAQRLVDPPRARLEHDPRTITCTTVFQAKGLAWDHVAVLAVGGGHHRLRQDTDSWLDRGQGRRRTVGLQFDPDGGFSPVDDPLLALNRLVWRTRYAEEGFRLAYVAVTRARRSVTIALPTKERSTRPACVPHLAARWTRLLTPHVYRRKAEKRREAPRSLPRFQVEPAGAALPTIPPPPPSLTEVAPSAVARTLDREERERRAQRIAASILERGGFTPGFDDDLAPPRARHPAFGPADWGTLVHGWLAAWRFRPDPREADVGAWLKAEMGGDDPAIRSWLLAISARMASRSTPLWDLVTTAGAGLRFEYPLVGTQDELLLTGRIDLLVELPQGVVVVDFKAGDRSPRSTDDIVDAGGLRTYGPQLEAYRSALERAGHRVLETALWFVRTDAQLRW